MRTIIEIEQLDNGSHRNQSWPDGIPVPEGYAVVPEETVCENWPFGNLAAEDVDGVLTLTVWEPLPIPPAPEPDPDPEVPSGSLEDRVAALEQNAASWDEMAQAYNKGVQQA